MTHREIKLRLWNPDRNVLTAGISLNTLLLTTDADFVKEFNYHKMVWMQYTGMKDKDGKEVYEGDVVKGVFPTREYKNYDNGVVIWSKVRCAFVVKIVREGVINYNDIISCDPNGTVNVETMTDYYIQVLGNLYQHPHLLTTK